MVIVFEDGTKTSKSYPKFVMEQKLGRELEDWETVDHKDGDKTNNDPNNFQILSRKANVMKSSMIRENLTSVCPMCSKEFSLTINQIKRRSIKKAGPFCSKSCSGKYGAGVQNNIMNPTGNTLVGKEITYKSEEGKEIKRLF